jgi:hypothetical protein
LFPKVFDFGEILTHENQVLSPRVWFCLTETDAGALRGQKAAGRQRPAEGGGRRNRVRRRGEASPLSII